MGDRLCDRPGKLSLEEARRDPPNVRRRDKTVKKFVQSQLHADFRERGSRHIYCSNIPQGFEVCFARPYF